MFMKFSTNFENFATEMVFLSTLRIFFFTIYVAHEKKMLKYKTGGILKRSDKQSSKGCFTFRLFPLATIRKCSYCVITVSSDTFYPSKSPCWASATYEWGSLPFTAAVPGESWGTSSHAQLFFLPSHSAPSNTACLS